MRQKAYMLVKNEQTGAGYVLKTSTPQSEPVVAPVLKKVKYTPFQGDRIGTLFNQEEPKVETSQGNKLNLVVSHSNDSLVQDLNAYVLHDDMDVILDKIQSLKDQECVELGDTKEEEEDSLNPKQPSRKGESSKRIPLFEDDSDSDEFEEYQPSVLKNEQRPISVSFDDSEDENWETVDLKIVNDNVEPREVQEETVVETPTERTSESPIPIERETEPPITTLPILDEYIDLPLNLDTEDTEFTRFIHDLSSSGISQTRVNIQSSLDLMYDDARKQARDASTVTPDMILDTKRLLKAFGCPFMVAPSKSINNVFSGS